MGLYAICGAGSSFLRHGFAIHKYTANKGMKDSAFMVTSCLFLRLEGYGLKPSVGGRLLVSHGEIVLPDLGPIGSLATRVLMVFLAAPRDFLAPTAWFEEGLRPDFTIVHKFGGELFTAKQDFSPFNVVAWHGNYVPYKYDLQKFCSYNTVLIDHGDPSINTVLTAPPTDKPGVALLDFVIFPPRWRRLIARVVNAMAPTKLTGTMAFMFESALIPSGVSFPRSRLLSVLDSTQVPLLPHILERD
ncbi:BnaCnng14590D [Brassica napus]|uniref:homogentisate 1,2-dioxygenase n=2 Tax=Brassica napus TaxID=3708 RepID=A0A078I7B1_BRANA|nr:BnaCnng14590D [Brassica napus]